MDPARGTITISTAAIGTTFPVSLGFTPKAVFLYWSGRATSGISNAQHRWGSGFFTSTSSRRAYASQSDHNVPNMVADTMWSNDCCVLALLNTGAVDGKADVNAVSNGFELIIDDQFGTALQVGYWAIPNLTHAEIVDFVEPGATGNQDIATTFALDTGIDNKAVIFLGGSGAASNTSQVDSTWMLGFAASNSIAQAVCAGASDDGAGTSATYSYSLAGECIANLGAVDTVTSRAALTVWQSTGFRLNWIAVDAGFAWNHSALVMRGGRFEVGNFLTRTDTTNGTEATTYVPKSLLLVSHQKGASTAGATGAHDARTIGVALSASNRGYATARDTDASNSSQVVISYGEDQIYARNDTSTTPTGLADLVSFDATPGFTYVMDDADPAAAFVPYLSQADAPEGPFASTLADATMAAAGSETITGTVSASTAAVTMAAAGAETFAGTFASTLAAVTMAAAGDVTAAAAEGPFAATLEAITMAAAGSETISGTVVASTAAVTMAAAGTETIAGTFNASTDATTMAATGAETISGAFASTLEAITMAAADVQDPVGPFAATLEAVTMAATGEELISGAFASTLAAHTMVSSGTIAISGPFASNVGDVIMAATGTIEILITGTFTATLDNVTMIAGVPSVKRRFRGSTPARKGPPIKDLIRVLRITKVI